MNGGVCTDIDITNAEAEEVLKSNSLPNKGQNVFLVAATTYWGPPGGNKPDFFHIWAATPLSVEVSSVKMLYACTNDGVWIESLPFALVKVVQEFSLWSFTFEGRFPVEFVLVMENEDGKFYDNNGGYGVNYRLRPYQGFAANIVVSNPTGRDEGSRLINVFPNIIPFKIVSGTRTPTLTRRKSDVTAAINMACKRVDTKTAIPRTDTITGKLTEVTMPIGVVTGKSAVPIDRVARKSIGPIEIVSEEPTVPIDIVPRKSSGPIDIITKKSSAPAPITGNSGVTVPIGMVTGKFSVPVDIDIARKAGVTPIKRK